MINCTLCNIEINNSMKRCDNCNFKQSRIIIVKKLNSNKKIRKSTIEKYNITIDDIKENSLVHSNTLKFLKDNTTNVNDISKLISISYTNEFKNLSQVLTKTLDKIEQIEQKLDNFIQTTNEEYSSDEYSYSSEYSSDEKSKKIFSLNKISNHPVNHSVNDLIKNSNSVYNNVYENFFKEYS